MLKCPTSKQIPHKWELSIPATGDPKVVNARCFVFIYASQTPFESALSPASVAKHRKHSTKCPDYEVWKSWAPRKAAEKSNGAWKVTGSNTPFYKVARQQEHPDQISKQCGSRKTHARQALRQRGGNFQSSLRSSSQAANCLNLNVSNLQDETAKPSPFTQSVALFDRFARNIFAQVAELLSIGS